MKKSVWVALSLLALCMWCFTGCGSSSAASPSTAVGGSGSNPPAQSGTPGGGSPGSSNGGTSGTSGGSGASGGSGGSGGSSGGGGSNGGGGTGPAAEVALIQDFSLSGSSAPTAAVGLYNVNTTTGEIQQSFAGELIGPAGSAAMNPAGTFLVTVGEGFHIAVYAINGQNAPTETSALTGNGAGGSQTLFTPNGQFLYSGAIFGGMGAYSLDSSGKLAMVPGSPFTPGGYPLGITPDGKFLYALAVPNGGSDPFSNQTIEVFSIDSTSGALTLVSGATEIPSVGHPTGNPSQRFLASAFTHSGHILFLGDHTTGNVYGFALNSSTGKATLASTTTVETAPPTAMTLSPDDSHLYVADGQDILGFSVNSNGTLAPLNGGALMATIPPSVQQSNSSPALFTVVDDVQVDLTGKFLYVLTPDELFAFNIGSNGILSPDSGANLIAPNAPFNRPWGELTFANLQ